MKININDNEITMFPENQAETFQLELMWTDISRKHKSKKIVGDWNLVGIKFYLEKYDNSDK